MSIITIASDFGTIDGYVGTIKGVIKSMAPDCEIIDVAHDLDGIVKASIALKRYYSFYPAGTVHLIIFDPTVGSDRKALIGRDGKYFFVGPDNGVFSRLIDDNPDARWLEIDSNKLGRREFSPTFHGRDIFAPAAALLASGKSPDDLGGWIEAPVILNLPNPREIADGIEGQIIDVDKFGNLMANIPKGMMPKLASVVLGECGPLRLLKTYSDVPIGKPLAYIGSLGYLEIGLNRGRADDFFGASIGDKVRITI